MHINDHKLPQKSPKVLPSQRYQKYGGDYGTYYHQSNYETLYPRFFTKYDNTFRIALVHRFLSTALLGLRWRTVVDHLLVISKSLRAVAIKALREH